MSTTAASATGWAARTWDSPNTAIINTFGELTNSRRHEIKADVSYRFPKVDVLLGGVYTGYSGRPYTPYQRYTNAPAESADQSAAKEIFLEPRGTERNDFFNNFDLRAEKAFRVQRPPVRRLRRHHQSVQHGDGDDAPGASIRARRSQGATVLYQAPTGGAGRAPGDVRRPLDVLDVSVDSQAESEVRAGGPISSRAFYFLRFGLLACCFERSPARELLRAFPRAPLPVVDVRQHVVPERRVLGPRRELETLRGQPHRPRRDATPESR